ncbi:MAG: TonB-dependent receptor, partial [Bacteroidota bacterium]
MKVLFLIFLLGKLSAQSPLSKRITLEKEIYEIKELVQELRDVHDLTISYARLPVKMNIQFKSKSVTVQQAINEMLKDSEYTYQLLKNKILILKKAGQSERATINGFIKDSKSGEALIGATIYDTKSGYGAITNNYGFFSLTLMKDSVDLSVSYLGFERINHLLFLEGDLSINFDMIESNDLLKEVVVSGLEYEDVELTPQMSSVSLTSKQIESVPMILGEYDVMKALQLLPGIQGGTEGSSGIYVRGGGPDQNLVLLDGVPVYNTSHVFGFFSVFNGDAINSVEVIKGGFPARYGGRLSSVIDITMKEGNNKEVKGKATIGLVSSKFMIEGPIKDERTSFILSGRRTYLDLIAKPFDVANGNDYYFYDFNAKINHRFSNKDRVFLSFYGGNDTFSSTTTSTTFNQTSQTSTSTNTDSGLQWGNIISVLRWNHVFNPKLFGAFSATYSRFQFDTFDERTSVSDEMESLEYVSGIRDYSLKGDFDYQVTPNYNIRFGSSVIAHNFNTGVIDLTSEENNVEEQGRDNINAQEYSTYLENDLSLGRRLRFNAGLHGALFKVDDTQYYSLQPRFSVRYLLDNGLSLKGSYSEMQQFIHLLTNSGIGLPTDLWVPATGSVEPQFSRQVALGAAKHVGSFEVSLETYWKKMDQLIEYENGASYLSTDTNWETKVESGSGTSYGAELLIRKDVGKLTGWIGYTWSKTTRQFDQLNFGREFDYKFDRRHDLSITGTYQLNKKWSISGNWIFGTGNALSLPLDQYLNFNQRMITGGGNGGIFDDFIANYY